MRLAFLFIAEAYQLYHAAATMFELIGRPDVEADIFYIDPEFPDHLELLRVAHEVPAIRAQHLDAGPIGKAIQSIKLLGLAKPQVLRRNEQRLQGYDAVISTEDGIASLFKNIGSGNRPARILMTHGAGTRYFPSMPRMAGCDLIVAKGPLDAQTYRDKLGLNADRVISGGYPKLFTTGLLSKHRESFFANENPTVLYNPHKEPRQRSWDRFFQPLLADFKADRSRNLIVAPHVKMFRRRGESVRETLRKLSDETILVDPASPSLLDNSYTEAASIYVGDVSSQVVEFIARPRPCVFLNAHGIAWQDNPHYALWHLGEVIEDPAELMPAIARASAIHERYAQRQAEFASAALGDTSMRSVQISANAIAAFVHNWQRQ